MIKKRFSFIFQNVREFLSQKAYLAVFPVVMQLGFDPIWFGVIIVLVSEMGVITPPVGVNVFVIKGIAPDIPLRIIFRGILPFLVALIVVTIIILFVPQIATYLPSLVTY